jgi:hypothetical protein
VAVLAPTPALTVLGLIGCAALVATAEWYLGTRRTVLVTVVGHLVTVGLGALVLLALRPTGWSWAVRLAGELGAGPIGGVLAAFTVAHGGVPGREDEAAALIDATSREEAASQLVTPSAGHARGHCPAGEVARPGPVPLGKSSLRKLRSGLCWSNVDHSALNVLTGQGSTSPSHRSLIGAGVEIRPKVGHTADRAPGHGSPRGGGLSRVSRRGPTRAERLARSARVRLQRSAFRPE